MKEKENFLLNDDDVLKKYFNELEEYYETELKEAENEIKKNLEVINRNLKKIEEELRKAEEEGDEKAYQIAFAKKQLILQKLQELESLMRIS